jgi:hypothetical protein
MVGRAPSSPRDSVGTFSALVPGTRRTLWVGGLVLAVGLLATGAAVRSTKHLYRSEGIVRYERGVLEGEPDPPADIGPPLAEMLTSPARLQRLIEEMRLYPEVVAGRGLPAAIDEMRADIKLAVRPGGSFGVSYDADDRDRARAVLRRLLNGVADDDAQRRQHDAETARQTLDRERQRAEEDLVAKEARLAAFSAEHPRAAAKSAVPANDRTRSADGAAEVASLELRAAELAALLARSGGRPAAGGSTGPQANMDAEGPPPADPAVLAARADIAANLLVAERDLDDKQTRLHYKHPDVAAALQRVAEARAALRKADAAVAASTVAVAAPPVPAKAVSGEKLASLQRALVTLRSRIAALRARDKSSPPRGEPAEAAEQISTSTSAADTDGTRLARDVSEARERRRQLEAKLFQAQLLSTLGAAGQGGGLVVSQPPTQPARPIAGPRLKVGLGGASISVLLALLALMVAGRLDGRVYGPSDVARSLGRDVVVVIPKLGIKLVGRELVRITNAGP